MDSTRKTTLCQRVVLALTIAAAFSWCGAFLSAQQPVRGTIAGRVTADQGQVRAARVAAHNLDRRIWYTVFTNKGQYTVPRALPGRYEVMVIEPGYDSPRVAVELAPGGSQSADLAVKMRVSAQRVGSEGGDEGPSARGGAGKVVYVDRLEDVYPAGAERDLLKEHCTGCHSTDLTALHYTREQYLRGIERMTETGPGYNAYVLALGRTPIDRRQKTMLAEYLTRHFGPGMPEKRLRVDPLVLDEEVASRSIYVSYDIPDDLPFPPGGNRIGAPMVDGVTPQLPPETRHHLQAASISPVDGHVWYSSRASSSILRLDPRQLDPVSRWKNYPIKGDPYVHPSGIAVDKQGKVYWAELRTARIGELDPATGKQIRYALPQQAGAVLQVVVDRDQNIGFSLIWGAFFGRLDAVTRRIHMYPTPTPDNGMYGLAFDSSGNMWGAGWQKGTISKWDAESQKVIEYKVPTAWGQIRRVGVDSRNVVWGSAYNTGLLVRLDPATGRHTEYKIPLNGAQPYDAWPDKSDNVWSADHVHSALVKLDPATSKWTFYPMPQPNQSVPKFEMADDNTIWFGTRGVPNITAVHFYPNGYTAEAPPLP